MTQDIEQFRAGFEAWARKETFSLARDGAGSYICSDTGAAWASWRSAKLEASTEPSSTSTSQGAAPGDALDAAPRAQWWLAEVDRYDNPKLVDGAHGDRAGADKAAFLFGSLGLTGDRKLAVAKVELSDPRPSSEGVNMEAVRDCNRARAAIATSTSKEEGK